MMIPTLPLYTMVMVMVGCYFSLSNLKKCHFNFKRLLGRQQTACVLNAALSFATAQRESC